MNSKNRTYMAIPLKEIQCINFVIFFLFASQILFSQEIDKWDNQIYMANKVAGGADKFKYSGELHVRLKDNMQQLDRWYIEGMASFLLSKHIEIVPDFRFNIKPDEKEIRPGFGVLYKHYVKDKYQFVHQYKWQIDIDNKGHNDQAIRYVLFINKKLNDKIIVSYAIGALYRWRKEDNFSGIQFFRNGPGIDYKFSEKHHINFSYFINGTNTGEHWVWAGVPFIQLIINLNKDYKYVPAKYFNF